MKQCEYPGCKVSHPNGCSADQSLKHWTCNRHFLLGTAVRLKTGRDIGRVGVPDKDIAPTSGTVFVQWHHGGNGYYMPDGLEAVDEGLAPAAKALGVVDLRQVLLAYGIHRSDDLRLRLDDAEEYRAARKFAEAAGSIASESDRLRAERDLWKGRCQHAEDLLVKAAEERLKMAKRLEHFYLEAPQASATAAAPSVTPRVVVNVDNSFWEDGD